MANQRYPLIHLGLPPFFHLHPPLPSSSSYLCSDDLPAIWDRRVYVVIETQLAAAEISHRQVKVDLKALAFLYLHMRWSGRRRGFLG